MRLAESFVGKEKVVEVIEAAFGGEVAFDKCAKSSDQILAVRNAINEIIKSNI